jgi:hypothetical protein
MLNISIRTLRNKLNEYRNSSEVPSPAGEERETSDPPIAKT